MYMSEKCILLVLDTNAILNLLRYRIERESILIELVNNFLVYIPPEIKEEVHRRSKFLRLNKEEEKELDLFFKRVKYYYISKKESELILEKLKQILLRNGDISRRFRNLSSEDKQCIILTYILSRSCHKRNCIYIVTDDCDMKDISEIFIDKIYLGKTYMSGQLLLMLTVKRIIELGISDLRRYIDKLYQSFRRRCEEEIRKVKENVSLLGLLPLDITCENSNF